MVACKDLGRPVFGLTSLELMKTREEDSKW